MARAFCFCYASRMRSSLFVPLALALVGCGTSTGPGGPDATADSAPVDAGPDSWHGCTGDAGVTECQSWTPPCPTTFDGNCTCTNCNVSVGTCGGYVTWSTSGTDTSQTAYYDADSGTLVAIVNHAIPAGTYCIAGPADFTPPASCTSTRCADGG
jgi:hypothetical protein